MVVQFDDAPKNTRGGNVTAVSLGNNMALPLLMAGMEGRADSWLECLQSTGALLSHRVCRQKRPISDDEKGAKDRKRFHGRYFDTPAAEQAGAGEVGRIKFPLTRSTGAPPCCAPLPRTRASRSCGPLWSSMSTMQWK